MFTEFFITAYIVLALVIWVWSLIDLQKTRFDDQRLKITSFLLIIFVPVLGSIAYFLLVKPKPRQFNPSFAHRD